VHNLVYHVPSAINFVAWSLEIEIQFYILAPLIAMLFLIHNAFTRRAILAALILGATGIALWAPSNPTVQLSLLGQAQFFLAGFAFVEFYLFGGDRRMNSQWWDAVSLVGWPSMIALLVKGESASIWVLPWLILALYVAAFHGSVMNRFVRNPWIVTIGGMCYTIYLLHNYIIALLGSVTERVSPGLSLPAALLLQLALMTPILLAVCALFFRLIERPCMNPNWTRNLAVYLRQLRRPSVRAVGA
jgi:peptidoglycan/LPS O-acetylase OafA/YrhL